MTVRVQVCRLSDDADDDPLVFWVDEDEFRQRVIFDSTGIAVCGEWFDLAKILHVHVDDYIVEPPGASETWN